MSDAVRLSCSMFRCCRVTKARWLRVNSCALIRRALARACTLTIQNAPETTRAVIAPLSSISLTLSGARANRILIAWSRLTGAGGRSPFTSAAGRNRDVEIDGRRVAGLHADVVGHGSDSLVPSDDGVLSRRDVVDDEPARGVGLREQRILEDEDDRAHVGVDVAEHLNDAGTLEHERLRRAAGITAEVKLLRAREREDVVKDAVLVREVHRRAASHGDDVRREALLTL